MCWRFVYSVYRCMYKSPIWLKRCPSPIPIALFLCWSWTHWLLLPVTSMAVATFYVWPLFWGEKSVWPQHFWANCDLSTLGKKNLLTKSRCFMIWMHLSVDWIENEPTTTVILSGSRQHSTGSIQLAAFHRQQNFRLIVTAMLWFWELYDHIKVHEYALCSSI